MKVTLYAIKYAQKNCAIEYHPLQKHAFRLNNSLCLPWKWFISLEMNVDVQHWSSHAKRNHCQIVCVTPEISLGQAVEWKDEWNKVKFTNHEQMNAWIHRRYGQKSALSTVLAATPSTTLSFTPSTTSSSSQLRHEPVCIDPASLDRLSRSIQGRSLMADELMDLLAYLQINLISGAWRRYIQALYLRGDVELLNGVKRETTARFVYFKTKPSYTCRRCGSGKEKMFWSHCVSCGADCPYCEACLNMGRARFCSLLIHGALRKNSGTSNSTSNSTSISMSSISSSKYIEATQPLQVWGLSPAQTEAAQAGLAFLSLRHSNAQTVSSHAISSQAAASQAYTSQANTRFLIWAVTGAGKTEMVFPLIESELLRGGRVLVAVPRRDVVLELQPRIQKAFANHSLVTLYGGSQQRWEEGDITLSTTHQLLRFWRKFDLIIMDEIDAYPFHNNPMLEYAVQKACAVSGRYILLSATPPVKLQKAIQRNMPHIKVSVRYHRHPLPVPKRIRIKPFEAWKGLSKPSNHGSNFPRALYQEIKASLDRGAQIFLFIPKIKNITPLLQLLERVFPHIPMEGTSSQDTERGSKVMNFRAGHSRIIVTTTILERGVTVPKTDVIVLDADSPQFDEAALVQMAGRSGRSSSDPLGRVFFFAQHKTQSQVKAIRQISAMNQLARKKGYLIHEGDH